MLSSNHPHVSCHLQTALNGNTLHGWDSKYTSEDDFLRDFHQHAWQLDLRVSTVSPSYPPVEIDTPGDWSVLMDHLSNASDCSSTVTPLEAGGATNDTHSSPASRMGTRCNPQSSTNRVLERQMLEHDVN